MKKTRRSQQKYPALNKGYNLKSRAEASEIDYLDQLSDSDKEFLNKFTEEFVNDSLDRKNLDNNLHNTRALIKDCDDRNNARKRDVITRLKAQGENYEIKASDSYSIEDELIARID